MKRDRVPVLTSTESLRDLWERACFGGNLRIRMSCRVEPVEFWKPSRIVMGPLQPERPQRLNSFVDLD